MLQLSHTKFGIVVFDDPNYSLSSVDNVVRHDDAYVLDQNDREPVSSKHVVQIFHDEGPQRSCILLAPGGASGVHEHSAIIVKESCIIAVGSHIASLAIPTLQLQWSKCVDSATCFGVYFCEDYDCLISHGELDITRLTCEGRIEWQSSGADIFTNGFHIFDDIVRAIDWNDKHYWFDIHTGKEIEPKSHLAND